MDIRLLGPVTAFRAGRALDLGPRRQRFVFAVLALDVNKALPADRLVELAWPVAAPRTAGHAIQVCVSGLRSALTRAGAGPDEAEIGSRGGAYVLRADPGTIDVHRFYAGLEQAAAVTDDARKVAVLTGALDLWSGPPLSAAGTAEARQRLCLGLEEARLTALEDRVDARLRLGDHQAVLGELATLTHAYPTRERLVGQRMLALYRSGQAGAALAVYRQVRQHFADDLGLDPGPRLQQLELAILRNDPSLASPTRVPPPVLPPSGGVRPGPDTAAVPAQELPPDVPAFAGRHSELAELDRILDAAGGRPAAVVCAVSGTGGVGKTALAVHWAHRVADRFPDGQLYVDLHGYDQGGAVLEPVVALRGFLDALAVPVERIPATAQAQTGLYRSLLAGKRALVVLDNARDEDQVRPLLPGTAGCLVVVTSRSQLTGLIAGGARAVVLGQLAVDEARDLLAGRLGADRIAAEPAAVEEIIDRCAGLPLALAVAAARAATHPGFPLSALAGELRSAGGLDLFGGDDPATDLRVVFASSYLAVSEPARRLFRLLGLHPGPDVTAPAAASLAGLDLRRTHRLLAELARAHLLTEHVPGRYACHDLLRAYAEEEAQARDDEPTRRTAVHRLLDHLLHAARAAMLVLDPHPDPIAVPAPLDGVLVERPDGHGQALAWFTAEHQVLLAAVQHADAGGFDRHAWQLAWAVSTFLYRQGHWYDQATVQHTAVRAARRGGELLGEAHALRNLALADARLNRLDEAYRHNRDALDLFGAAGDVTAQAHTHLALAWVLDRQGRDAEALRHSEQALDLYRSADHRVGEARALNDLAWSHAQLGEYRRAVDTCWQALAVHQELHDLEGEASTWDSLGFAQLRGGGPPEAVLSYRRALDRRRLLGDRYGTAETLTHLGEVYAVVGDAHAAHGSWQEALDILTDLAHPDADLVRVKLTDLARATG